MSGAPRRSSERTKHEREQAEVDGGGIDIRVVAADGAALFELSNALEYGRRGQPDTTSDLGIRDAGVGLQCFEDGE